MNVHAALANANLHLSRITYNCNLQRASGLIIPLGAMAELIVGPVRVLGLIARTQLAESEIASIGRLIQPKLSNPFEFLKLEFEWAWKNTASGQALFALAHRHAESLFFSPPEQADISQLIAQAAITVPMLASEELKRQRDSAFVNLMEASEVRTADSEIDEWSKIKPWMIPQRTAAPMHA